MQVKNGKNLVVSRSVGEKIVIGDPTDPIGIIEIVSASGSGRVKVACLFSSTIPVNREEVATCIAKYADDIEKKSNLQT